MAVLVAGRSARPRIASWVLVSLRSRWSAVIRHAKNAADHSRPENQNPNTAKQGDAESEERGLDESTRAEHCDEDAFEGDV